MKIHLENLGKRFNREILYQNLNFTFSNKGNTAIVGQNGSGKSTLIQLIAGNQLPSSGNITYEDDGQVVDVETIYKEISIAAPYLELIEEFTLLEQVHFHFKFKKCLNLTVDEMIEDAYFTESKHKQIKNFSSGMKQRLKLMLAFNSDTKILLLDEPTSNLDESGTNWFFKKYNEVDSNRTLILASNQHHEFDLCEQKLDLERFK